MAGYKYIVYMVFTCWMLESVAPFAIPGQCTDKVQCSLYSATVCNDPQYFQWAAVNCPNFCKMCTTEPPAGEGKVVVAQEPTCTDALTNCADYGTKMCEDVRFYTWTNENCRAHCNRCTIACEDKVQNCAEYGETLCTNLSYYNWVEMNCRKYCARCTP